MAEIDWSTLRARAIEVRARAYVPYSHYPVGAAGLTADGRVVASCNVENASYGLTLCAECGLVSDLHSSGGDRLLAVAIVDGNGSSLMPCGRCRQLLLEAGGPDLLIDDTGGPRRLDTLLPDAFSAADLDARKVNE